MSSAMDFVITIEPSNLAGGCAEQRFAHLQSGESTKGGKFVAGSPLAAWRKRSSGEANGRIVEWTHVCNLHRNYAGSAMVIFV